MSTNGNHRRLKVAAVKIYYDTETNEWSATLASGIDFEAYIDRMMIARSQSRPDVCQVAHYHDLLEAIARFKMVEEGDSRSTPQIH